MSKGLLIVLITLVISGCQIKQLLPTDSHMTAACSTQDMHHWIAQEQAYQQASAATKSAMLKHAAEHDQTTLLAILLSQPDNTTAQIRQSIRLFEQLDLNNSQCDTQQYLLVRYQYTLAVMTLQRALNTADLERKAVAAERDKFKQQIEALTRIENDLSH
ncbi:hypothetical protein Q4488_02265 [Amphritea sp. 1_MG-2023]|uniref:hypothetical protein n=1 Tax=Amphritea sp. 1_MG-2023 TaxID=3062670 RepID=UPI0026E2D9EB|nr:hypothetical protein [Amphritea sp. 1_MG-2023]MDO6562196.1 hypothetical protein [Amphritea sp. 1_MG-2023]